MSFLGSAAGAIGGSLVGGLVGSYSAKQNAALALKNWKYQQSHAHQLEVEDLKNAGLNPILSATNSQMAGISSVSGSDYGAGQAFSNAIQAEYQRRMQKENKLIDVTIHDKELEYNYKKLELEDYIAKKQAELWAVQGNFYNSQSAKASAETAKVFEDIANNKLIANATVRQLESGTALNYQQIEGVKAQMLKAVADANLSDTQSSALKKEIESGTRALENKSASMQSEFLDTWFGRVAHQFGYGLSLVNPFSGIASKIGNVSVGSRK